MAFSSAKKLVKSATSAASSFVGGATKMVASPFKSIGKKLKGSQRRRSTGRVPAALRPWSNALENARNGNGGRGVSGFKFNGKSYKKSSKKIGGRPVYYRVCSNGKRCKSKSRSRTRLYKRSGYVTKAKRAKMSRKR